MKKTEMHVHVSPISYCAHEDAKYTAERYYKCGFKAIHLTNHINHTYIEMHGVSYEQWLDDFMGGYHEFKDECAKYGIEVFLGAEVTLGAHYNETLRAQKSLEELMREYADYILVGVTEKFLRENTYLNFKTQEELFEICDKNGVLMIQAHPFRVEQRHSLKKLDYVHGLEVNGNLAYPSFAHEEEILKLAHARDLIVTCGGDVHNPWDKLNSCTFIPDDVHDSSELAAWLREVKTPEYSMTQEDLFVLPRP